MRMTLRISTLDEYGHVQILLYKKAPFCGRMGPQLIHGSLDMILHAKRHIDTIRYDTRCYINVRSKANMSQLNLPHGADN